MMKRRADGLGCWLALAVMFFLLSSFSKATAAGWTIHQDGRLTVDSFTYSSFSHYFQSDAFKQSGRRCGTVRPPFRLEPFAVPSDCGLNQSANLDEYGPAQIYEIPVVVHIIMQSDGVGNISDSRVASQIEILNEDYMAIFGTPGGNGTDGGVRFRLATVDPSGNPTTGITRTTNNNWFHDNDEYGFKSALGWDQSRYLNIFTNSAGGYLGYAYFPQAYAGTVRDGVVILYSAFGRDSGYPPYDQGRTATHEVGHYLGLEHTFEGGCQSHMSPECYSSGDLICDTNSEQEPAYGCPQGRVTCNSPDPIHNYMDYSNDTCMTNYTPQQVRRMRCALEHYRSALYKVVPYLDADFIAERTRGIQPLTVSFTDTSIGTIDSYTWDFGDGATSTLRNPSHTYLQAGNFTVSLSVTGPWGTDTETKSKFVHVLETFPSGLFELLLLENRPYLQLSGTSHSFGNIRLDSHADWKLTVRNGGSADLTISAYTGLPSNGFDLLNGPTPPFSIPSKGSVEFEIRYHPSSWGLNRATFTIHSNAENAPIATVSLKGYCLFYEIVDLGTLGGNESSARAINDMGCIVGRSKTPDGDFHAFFWDTINGMQDIGTAGYTSSGASDINNLNQVSGTTQTPPRAFVWDDENGIQYLSRIESPDLSAAGINDAGMIVGSLKARRIIIRHFRIFGIQITHLYSKSWIFRGRSRLGR